MSKTEAVCCQHVRCTMYRQSPHAMHAEKIGDKMDTRKESWSSFTQYWA